MEKGVGKTAKAIVKAAAIAIAMWITVWIGSGCVDSDDNGSIEGQEITWAEINGVEKEYDGQYAGVRIKGLRYDDEAYYSADGREWQKEALLHKAVGEYEVWVRIEHEGYKTKEERVKIIIRERELHGISARDKRIIYDGKEHGIEIEGIEKGDRIEYEVNGEKQETLGMKEVGEYEIRYTVKRECGKYEGECKVIILPRISGKYVNEQSGKIELSETETNYDINGKGKLSDGREYKVTGKEMEIEGEIYTRMEQDERMYGIEINGTKRYAIGKATITIEIECGKVSIDGKEIYDDGQSNYCEKVIGEEIERDYERNAARIETDKADTVIQLTKRKEKTETERIEQRVLYDGKGHGTGREDVLIKTPEGYKTDAEYTEAGKYISKAVILSAEYLPQITEWELTIAKDMTGVYYREDGVIEIEKEKCRVNGEEKELEYDWDEYGTIDGRAFEIRAGTMEWKGKEYGKQNGERITVITSGAEVVVKQDISTEVYILSDANGVIVTTNGEELMRIDGAKAQSVTVDGVVWCGFNDGEIALYILGMSETNRHFLFVVIETS